MSVTINEKNTTAEVSALIDNDLLLNPLAAGHRREAREAFQRLGLPEKKAEEYKHTPLTRLLQKNFNFESRSGTSKLDATPFFVPGLDSYVVVLVNGIFAREQSQLPDETITVTSLSEAVESGNLIASAHLGRYADVSKDAFVAWNAASWNNGVFVHVPKRVVLDKPIVIYHVHDAASQVISASRNLIVVDKEGIATIIEKYDSSGSSNHFSNNITEAVVAENATLNLYAIQNDPGNRFQFAHTQIHQLRDSRVNTYTFTLDGKVVRNNLYLSLDGEGIESHMYGLYLLSGDTLADNHTVVDHRQPNSFSNEIYKGVMDDRSKGVFNGKIYVRPHAQKTNAFQANRNILLSDDAAVNTKPQLEIWADDVKCSHGCTSGQLDEEALFYLRTRGIHEETARAMMLYAFAGEILENVGHPDLKAYLDSLVSERLHKDF
jgi:Fe-S cluster assembly protein SufD